MSYQAHFLRRAAPLWRCFAEPISIAVVGALSCAPVAAAQQAAGLTLEDAIRRAVAADPGLHAAQSEIAAAQAGVRQARARINPEFSTEVENFGGQGDLAGTRSADSTFTLSSELDLFGQRRSRIGLADRDLHGAELDRVLRGLNLIRDVQIAYANAQASQEAVAITRERLGTAESLNTAISRRVSAARDPLMAGARAEAGLAEARVALARAISEAATARARLASYLGADDGFALDGSAFTRVAALDHQHIAPTDSSPDLARLSLTRDRAAAAVRVESSLSWKNPRLSLGYRRFEDRAGDGALVAGVSIPLGIFDRNQGGIARAQAEKQGAEYELEAARRNLLRDFTALQRARTTDADAVRASEESVIPAAARALRLAQDGYNRGAFSYLDVIGAQQALSDARSARLDALKSLQTNEADLDRLTARFADTIPVQEVHK